MKKIKVELTPREWAEKRLQLILNSYEFNYQPERFDSLLETCGFVLKEEADEQPEYEVITKPQGCIDGYAPLSKPNYKSKDGTIKMGVKLDSSGAGGYFAPCGDLPEPITEQIPTDKVEAVKYFLNQLPDGYRQRALAQVHEKRVNSRPIVQDITTSIDCFNIWDRTKEGVKFWNIVYRHYLNPTEYPTLPPLPEKKLDDPSTKEWTGYFTESGERVYLNGEYVFNDVKMRIEKKESQYVCVREDGFVQPLYHVFIYHKP